MRLKAEVKQVAVRGIHKMSVRQPSAGDDGFEDMPDPVRIEIESDEAGTCMLYRYDAAGRGCGDTWHSSVKEAKENAAYEYKITEDEWAEAAAS